MDHLEAKRLQAAEKYVLGELPEALRDEYEEHYFDCAECAADVRATATFVGASREIFQEERSPRVAQNSEAGDERGWFAWLRPAIAVPVMAGLAAIVVYQNAVTIPAVKQRRQDAAQVFESTFRLQGATRGENVSKVLVAPNESFALDFDFTPSLRSRSYSGRLVDEAGNSVLSAQLSGEKINKEVHLVIPGGVVKPGRYELVFTGSGEGSNQEAQRLIFEVEIHP